MWKNYILEQRLVKGSGAYTLFFTLYKRRNRLKNEKVEKMAFIYINFGLMDMVDSRDYFCSDNEDKEDEEDE